MKSQLIFFIVLLSNLLTTFVLSQRELGKYNVDQSKISTSGISSGAAMATQMHVAYSAIFMGVGMVAGNPYYCAQGSSITATGDCMNRPSNINVGQLTTQTTYYASNGDIDATSNMYGSRVYIFAGAVDTVVDPGVGMKAEEYYRVFVQSSNIKTVYDIQAEHTFPTENYGNPCTYAGDPYIGRCSYHGAYEILNHIYGGLTRPSGSTAVPGDFYEFDQTEFFYISPPSASSMDTIGYAYVPSGCVSGANVCRLHVVFHGCSQGRYKVGDEFARNSGYNEVGELNNIIIIYPQAISSAVNPYGCWDWWGYTVYFYATKEANQPLAVWRMVEKAAY
jgi:poly(3-hydroxybutyrate) depolymerase